MDQATDFLRYLFAGVLIIASLVLLMLLLVAAGNLIKYGSLQNDETTQRASTMSTDMLDGSNAVTNAFASIGGTAIQTVGSTAHAVGGTSWNAITAVGRGIHTGVTAVGSGIGKVTGLVSNPPSVSSLLRPGDDVELPVIDSYTYAVLAAEDHADEDGHHRPEPDPKWPMRGRVTTEFGVPHWPWQPTHTGIDISSGMPSGVTHIKPYKSGKVTKTIHSGYGLGNHVIVDHGGGISSVYAHLHSISVKVGQNVTKSTTLGLEGSTGASTGTHLHFEIRVNGKPTDPKQHIRNHP